MESLIYDLEYEGVVSSTLPADLFGVIGHFT
jgi:hypothetical protein